MITTFFPKFLFVYLVFVSRLDATYLLLIRSLALRSHIFADAQNNNGKKQKKYSLISERATRPKQSSGERMRINEEKNKQKSLVG